MLTAETVTDDEIRAFQNEPTTDLKFWIICGIALDENPTANPVADRSEMVRKARARVAALINARSTPSDAGGK